MRILFMGTPEFAVSSLKKLEEEHEILAVFTKIDKPNQRGKKIQYTPVKQYALEHHLEVLQPNSIRDVEVIQKIRDYHPDLIVVVAYGKILPKEILEIPKYGVINVHSSLLPKYRGAAPIHASIIHGEKESGVSIMYVVEELDAGPVLAQASVEILEEDNCASLHDRLQEMGANLLIETIRNMEKQQIQAIPQDEAKTTFVKPFRKEDCKICWNQSAREIFNFVRGMDPFPGAFTIYQGKQFKIARVEEEKERRLQGKAGEILSYVKGKGVLVATGSGNVIITKAKPENKKMLSGVDLINGNFLREGEHFE